MYPSKVSKFLNVCIFFQNALNSNFLFSSMSSTVIFGVSEQWFRRNLAGFWQNLKKWPESHEFIGIRRNPVNPLLRRHVPGQIYSSPTSLGPKKRGKREEKKKNQSRPNFAGITVKGILEKKNWKCLHWEKLKLWGAHCEFLNIGGRIENHPKLQGTNPYFPLVLRGFSICIIYRRKYKKNDFLT